MLFSYHTPLEILRQKSRLIVVATLIFGLAAFGASLLFPLEYRADAQVLIISRSRYGVDPYTALKSAEGIGENIVQIMHTNDFFDKVLKQPNYTLNTDRFSNISEYEKRKRWEKTVTATVVYGTGVLNISTYSTNPDEALKLAGAVADTLASHGWEYVSGDVTIKVVNQPVVTKWPVRPNLLMNTALGLLIGFLITCAVTIKRFRT